MDKTEVSASAGMGRMDAVHVRATARLHLGFLDLHGGLGRRFGSIGLSIDGPGVALTLRRAARPFVDAPEPTRAGGYLVALERGLVLPGPHALHVTETIPPHTGLGSGTQLALALGAAIRRLHGRAPDPAADAALLGRGGRSGVGVALFSGGGCVVDGGHGRMGGVPPVLTRLAVPAAWRIVLVIDRAHEGLSGPAERAAFAALPPMPDVVAGAICRSVLVQALPALAEADLPAFGTAITHIQDLLGEHFAPAQGDHFTSPRVAAAMPLLAAAGAVGLGQSSWGPTGFAFLPDEAAAARCLEVVAGEPAAEGLVFRVCRAANHGARVTVSG